MGRWTAITIGIAVAVVVAWQARGQVTEPDFDLIEACAEGELGEGACKIDDLALSLGVLDRGHVSVFGDIGVESFAMLTALRFAATSLAFMQDDDGCAAEEERYAAVEVWSLWVSLPNDAPDIIADKFDVYSGVMDKIVQLELQC